MGSDRTRSARILELTSGVTITVHDTSNPAFCAFKVSTEDGSGSANLYLNADEWTQLRELLYYCAPTSTASKEEYVPVDDDVPF